MQCMDVEDITSLSAEGTSDKRETGGPRDAAFTMRQFRMNVQTTYQTLKVAQEALEVQHQQVLCIMDRLISKGRESSEDGSTNSPKIIGQPWKTDIGGPTAPNVISLQSITSNGGQNAHAMQNFLPSMPECDQDEPTEAQAAFVNKAARFAPAPPGTAAPCLERESCLDRIGTVEDNEQMEVPVFKERGTLVNRDAFLQSKRLSVDVAELKDSDVTDAPGSKRARGTRQLKLTFPDADAMKRRIKEQMMKPAYNVTNFYKETGPWQAIARHQHFENVTLTVIGMNAIWIAIDTDHNHAPTLMDAHPVFIIVENLFCVFFLCELFVRIMAFRRLVNGLKDGWFVFDSCLVATMVCETWIMSLVLLVVGVGGTGFGDMSILRLVRLLRLTRMARMVRLLRAMPELMVLVKGMVVAMRSVFFTLALLSVMIYIFGIAFTQLMQGTSIADEYFKSVPDSMTSLLLRATLPDQADIVYSVGEEHPVYAWIMLFFILLATLTVLNMLVGVLCEVVSVVSAVEKEQMMVQFVKAKMLELIATCKVDTDGNQCISRDEFENLLLLPEGARIIRDIGVDVISLVDYADFIFRGGRELSFPELFELLLQLRGSNVTTVKDLVDLRKFITDRMCDLEESLLDRQAGKSVKSRLSITPLRSSTASAAPR